MKERVNGHEKTVFKIDSTLVVAKVSPDYSGIVPEKGKPIVSLAEDAQTLFPGAKGVVVLDRTENDIEEEMITTFAFDPKMSFEDFSARYGLPYEVTKRFLAYGIHAMWKTVVKDEVKDMVMSSIPFEMDAISKSLLEDGRTNYLEQCLRDLDPNIETEADFSKPGTNRQLKRVIELVDEFVDVKNPDVPSRPSKIVVQVPVVSKDVSSIDVERVVGGEKRRFSLDEPFVGISILRKKDTGAIRQYYCIANDGREPTINRYSYQFLPTDQPIADKSQMTEEQLEAENERMAKEKEGLAATLELEREMGISFVDSNEAQVVINLLQALIYEI